MLKNTYANVGGAMGELHFGKLVEFSGPPKNAALKGGARTHGDANPSNIFVSKQGKVTLIDNDKVSNNNKMSALPFELSSL